MVNQSFAALGLRGEHQFVVGEGGLATLSGGLGWRRGFGEAPTAQNAFIGGSSFAATAAPAADDALLLEGGFNLDLAQGLDLAVTNTGEVAETGQSHVLKAGLSGSF